jgi:ATP-dependent DNA ligase
MAEYLYTRDSKGKVRLMEMRVLKFKEHYEIHRKSGVLGGKMVEQPILTILKGKVKRSVLEQTELEWRSIVNKQRDKGYKLLQELGNDVRPYDYDVLDSLLSGSKTDSTGVLKPMLAKDVSGWPHERYGKKNYWFSVKLDGVRVSVRLIEGRLVASSRGGKNYDAAMTNIFRSEELTKLIKGVAKLSGISEDEVMIDGELYIHGRPLHYISGAARLDEYEPGRHDELEFWVFDYGHPTHTAEERCKLLNHAAGQLNGHDSRVKILHHVQLKGYAAMKEQHDIFVQAGFEGGIGREATKIYFYGGRDERMIKFKEFKDDEFEIIGLVEGLRAEDMCFRCITEDGKEFSAKPMGTREVKYQYIKDIENIIGKKLTVKFFNYTPDGVPFLPIGKVIRDYE